MNKRIRFLTTSAMIAALYVVLTLLSAALGLSSGAIQVRFSEALCILPCFTTAAIPGLFFGCLIANFFTGTIWDVVLGSLATLLGALGTYWLRKWPILATLPPIIANALVIPFVIALASEMSLSSLDLFVQSLPVLAGFAATVGLGEVISCGVLGLLLYPVLNRYKNDIFTV